MGAPVLEGAFTMPMFRDFVPRKIRPWIYLLMAVTFQLSGGLYMGTVNRMAGETSLMREDLMMCLYANLAGLAIWFPMLLRISPVSLSCGRSASWRGYARYRVHSSACPLYSCG